MTVNREDHERAIRLMNAKKIVYIPGVGSLKYGGNPKTKNTKRTGVGSINEM